MVPAVGASNRVLFLTIKPLTYAYQQTTWFDNLKVVIKSPTRTETVAVADIITLTDYYPFGMAMPGRTLSNSEHYRYGFNGMEKDDDWYGAGNEYTTEFRQLDVRVGRWMSMDPMMAVVPDRTPYEFVFNNPVSLTDPTGLFPGFGKGKKGGGDIPTRTPRYRHEDSGGSGAGASSGPSAIGGMLRSVADFVVSAAKFVNKNSDVIVTASNTLNELSRRSTLQLPEGLPRPAKGRGYGMSYNGGGNGRGDSPTGEESEPTYSYNEKDGLTALELYMEILIDEASEQLGIKDLVAIGAILSGQPILPKRFKTPGSTPRTSPASKYLSKIPGESPFKLPTITNRGIRYTKSIGRFAGRTVPVLGWGGMAYDIGVILYKTQTKFNEIVETK